MAFFQYGLGCGGGVGCVVYDYINNKIINKVIYVKTIYGQRFLIILFWNEIVANNIINNMKQINQKRKKRTDQILVLLVSSVPLLLLSF